MTPRRSVEVVYVHAPFCARRCGYCDFAVTVRGDGDARGAALEWAEAIGAELCVVEREGLFELAPLLRTLYVGGGTPSLLGGGAMGALAGLLGRDRLSHAELEWTVEANPESLTCGVAEAWREAGVNRVSLGAQTFHEPTLRWMGRVHGPGGVTAAVRATKDAGIENVSVDLMFGLPRALGRAWEDDLDRALALDVPHVSLYGLSVEPGTPLGRAVAAGREPPLDEEGYRDEFLLAAERLTSAGYEHYEVSNFARPGFASRHNTAYWDGTRYLGLGNGAHSYAHPVRRWNEREWATYRERVLAGVSPEAGREVLDEDAIALERVWLALRTSRGAAESKLAVSAERVVDRWVDEGLARRSGKRVRLTALGWLELDGLAVELDVARARAGASPPTAE